MWRRTNARVACISSVARDTVAMELLAPDLACEAAPGQFVHVICGEHTAPFLRRPISLHTIDRQSGKLGLLFRVVGEGTGYLASLKTGDTVDIMGPLGNGWPNPDTKHVTMVAGGIGVAPMPAAAIALKQSGVDVLFLFGAKNAGEVYGIDDVIRAGVPVQISTDDGSQGHHGFVTDLLIKSLDSRGSSPTTIMACGPAPMLRRVQSIAHERSVRCYVSLEQRMGCGVGACLGCTVKTALDSPKYKKVCVDGPVFDAGTVVIESV